MTKNTTTTEEAVIDVDLDAIIAQKAEARGDDGDTVAFRYKGKNWTFRDPETLTDPEKDELAELDYDVDIAAWYMGDDQYDQFVEQGGSSSLFFIVFKQHQKKVRDEVQGRPTRSNRSSRRSRKR